MGSYTNASDHLLDLTSNPVDGKTDDFLINITGFKVNQRQDARLRVTLHQVDR